ncbi:MAG: hypothetical protein MUE78_07240 [Ilumatobacteraceae bacterium]|nr:hypothetical protein [Ilumatobacteraceae bacterium]
MRDEAVAATERATGAPRPRAAVALDPEVVGAIRDEVGERRAPRLIERLGAASQALDRERFDEARRMVAPVLREAPGVAAAHEVAGLADYRRGRWKPALSSLETARALRPSPELLPVIADCQRALRRWADVERTWAELKRASPSHEVMAEGRIVAAGALADRGDLTGAIRLMEPAASPPKRVRDHHLRQWYVLGDLHDRAGDVVGARRWFRLVAQHDPGFVDVGDRLRALGR